MIPCAENGGRSLLVHEDNDDLFLAISIDGIHALEQFVLAKYYMTTQVYRHKIRLITDQMIARAISLGIESDNIEWLRQLYSYDGSEAYLEEYLNWDDDRVLSKLIGAETPDGYAKHLFQRLRERKLLKCIFDADQNDFEDPRVRSLVFADSKDFYGPLEKAVAKRFGFDENLVIAYTIRFDSATRTESEIPVIHSMKTTVFHGESALFRSVDQKIREQHFHIYAPAIYKDERDKKRQLREFKNGILDLITEILNPQPKLPLDGGDAV